MAPDHFISVSVPWSIIFLDGHVVDCPLLSQTDHEALAHTTRSAPNPLTAFQLVNLGGMMGDMFIGSINKAADGFCGDKRQAHTTADISR